MVNVNVLVCELNWHTTVAVENCPELTPAIVIVSARETIAVKLRTVRHPRKKKSLRNVFIYTLPVFA